MSAITDRLGYKIVDPWMNLHLPEHGSLYQYSDQLAAIVKKFHRLDILIKGFTEEEHLADMDRAGVEKAVLSSYGRNTWNTPTSKYRGRGRSKSLC